mmetsp:Transcript_108135/g.131931  ORF Transcript_108135/g.131931 Transcript_108135/m.131931 type:complete len:270 (-) Transcript_108135:19-828(-)
MLKICILSFLLFLFFSATIFSTTVDILRTIFPIFACSFCPRSFRSQSSCAVHSILAPSPITIVVSMWRLLHTAHSNHPCSWRWCSGSVLPCWAFAFALSYSVFIIQSLERLGEGTMLLLHLFVNLSVVQMRLNQHLCGLQLLHQADHFQSLHLSVKSNAEQSDLLRNLLDVSELFAKNKPQVLLREKHVFLRVLKLPLRSCHSFRISPKDLHNVMFLTAMVSYLNGYTQRILKFLKPPPASPPKDQPHDVGINNDLLALVFLGRDALQI